MKEVSRDKETYGNLAPNWRGLFIIYCELRFHLIDFWVLILHLTLKNYISKYTFSKDIDGR